MSSWPLHLTWVRKEAVWRQCACCSMLRQKLGGTKAIQNPDEAEMSFSDNREFL